MKNLLHHRFAVQCTCLLFVIALMSFKSSGSLPSYIVGSFSNPYNNLSSDCEYPLEFVVCNNGTSTYSFLRVVFTGNGGGSGGVQVTGVSGGSNIRYMNNNQVRIDLGASECATITVNAKFANNEQKVQAYLDGEYADGVNVVFDQTAQSNCQ